MIAILTTKRLRALEDAEQKAARCENSLVSAARERQEVRDYLLDVERLLEQATNRLEQATRRL